MLRVEISKDIYDSLIKRLGGRIYVDATDILDSVLKLEPVPEKEYDNYKKELSSICRSPSTKGCKHLYSIQDGVGLVFYHKAPRFYGWSAEFWLGIWRNSKLNKGFENRIFDNSLIYVSCNGTLMCEDRKSLYFRYINFKMYCSIVDTGYKFAESEKVFIRQYIEDKKWEIIHKLKDKLKLSYYSFKLDTEWRRVKKKYKEFKRLYQSYPDRALLDNSSKVDDLREAGWKFYENCQACEPKEPIIVNKYQLVLRVNKYKNDYYWFVIKDNKVIVRIPWRFLSFHGKKYVIELDDLRIEKYLKKSPGLFTTKFEDIPYFKWAVEKVIEKIKEYKNVRDGL